MDESQATSRILTSIFQTAFPGMRDLISLVCVWVGAGGDAGMGEKGVFVCVYEISDLSFLYSHSKFMLVYITQYFTLFSVVQVCDLESHGHDFETVVLGKLLNLPYSFRLLICKIKMTTSASQGGSEDSLSSSGGFQLFLSLACPSAHSLTKTLPVSPVQAPDLSLPLT